MKYVLEANPFKGYDGRYRYLYVIKHVDDNWYYYGVHSTYKLDDNYKGSGKILKNYIIVIINKNTY